MFLQPGIDCARRSAAAATWNTPGNMLDGAKTIAVCSKTAHLNTRDAIRANYVPNSGSHYKIGPLSLGSVYIRGLL